MGWKRVKDHYGIGHTVHVRDGCICIGSPYISDLIVIGVDGVLKKRADNSRNEDLDRYQREFDADPAKLKRLINEADTFSASIPVYTWDGGTIIEKRCETLGWPNATHDGCLMYDNTFSHDKAKIVRHAKRNAEAGITIFTSNVEDQKERLAKQEQHLAEAKCALEKLRTDYPEYS